MSTLYNILLQRLTSNSRSSNRRAGHSRRRRMLPERLEDRTLLTAYVVDTIGDDPTATANDTDGLISLREAIQAASTNAPFGDAPAGEGNGVIDTITFHDSLNGETIVLDGEELTIEGDLQIIGPGLLQLTISAGDHSRIFSVLEGFKLQVTGLTLSDGSAEDGGAIMNLGELKIGSSRVLNNEAWNSAGAIWNEGILEIADSAFEDNRSEGTGGGIRNTGLLLIEDSLFARNASEGSGGAVYNRGSGRVTVRQSMFQQNSASSGAAIYSVGGFNDPQASLDVAFSEFIGNQAGVGGAIYIYHGGPSQIHASRFEDNFAWSWGGAIANLSGTLIVSSSSFFHNRTNSYGGAIDNSNFGGNTTLHLIDSTLAGNYAGREGGAIANEFARLQIVNTTISGNSTPGDGGGIWNSGHLSVNNSTIVLNRADELGSGNRWGGGIFVEPWAYSAVFNNAIVAENYRGAASESTADDISGLVDAGSAYNLIGDVTSAGGLLDVFQGNIVGNSGIGTLDITTVLETSLADNGGPTLTHALLTGSPAIDAGDNNLAIDTFGNPLQTDQRGSGFSRISGGRVDIGAFELIQPLTVSIDIQPNILNLNSNGVIAVAILSTADFSAATVDVGTVVFAGASVVSSSLQDVNGDGLPDLVLHFRVQETQLATIYSQLLLDDMDADGILDSSRQTFSVTLTGQTIDGESISGSDDLELFFAGQALRDLLDQLFS